MENAPVDSIKGVLLIYKIEGYESRDKINLATMAFNAKWICSVILVLGSI